MKGFGDKMRLWHERLIPLLPNQQLLGQHREICALRGLGWNKKHSVVDYVFCYPYSYLFDFHILVIHEMEKRGYHVHLLWKDIHYRGQRLGYDYTSMTIKYERHREQIYTEHNEVYFQECLNNLRHKGIYISM